jgi:hypothetical protein
VRILKSARPVYSRKKQEDWQEASPWQGGQEAAEEKGQEARKGVR